MLRSLLWKKITGEQLQNCVEMPGSSNEIAKEYATAEFVVVPSRHEAFGLVTAEAMASGKAVIGFDDCWGSRELIKHGVNGWLVSGQGDRASSLANGLEQLIKNEQLRVRLGSAAPSAVSRFEVSAVCDEWETLFQQLVTCETQKRSMKR